MNAASEPERTDVTGDSKQLSGKLIATPLPSLDPDKGALRAGLLSAELVMSKKHKHGREVVSTSGDEVVDGALNHIGTRVPKSLYLDELDRLQFELVRLQYWVKERGQRVVVLFEGRDAAGKGGTIKR